MKYSLLILVTVVLIACTLSSSSYGQTNSTSYFISKDFANAVDYAMGQVVADAEFQKGMTDLGMIFSTPACSVLPYTRTSLPDAPKTLNLPRIAKPLVLCYESDALLNWPKVHELAGRIMIKILNSKYSSDIPYTFVKVNTTALGYFNTLKSLVDSGSCDVAIASSNLDTTRLPLVHFNCPYGSSSPGFLRSSLDNGTVIINSESDIDSANVTVLTYKGSSYDTYVKSKYKNAKLISVPSGYSECFDMILKKQAHVLLGDATDMAQWLSVNRAACGSSCFTKIYGDPFSFGSFITNNIRESNGNISNGILNKLVMILAVILLIFTAL